MDIYDILRLKKAYGNKYIPILPMDTNKFPLQLVGPHTIELNGNESWNYSGGAVYTSTYKDIISNQDRSDAHGFCADYTFMPDVMNIASMDDETFIFNGTSSIPVNGNLSFKGEHTATKDEWLAWLEGHPVKILITTNDPGEEVWIPVIDKNGVTGYYCAEVRDFIPVFGGIPGSIPEIR